MNRQIVRAVVGATLLNVAVLAGAAESSNPTQSKSPAGSVMSGSRSSAPKSLGAASEISTYIVTLRQPALAAFPGGAGMRAIPRNSKGRLDMKSVEAATYVGHLQERQREFVDDAKLAVGRSLEVRARFQHALNAVVMELSGAEASALRSRADVLRVELDVHLPLDTDAGPTLIGAPQLWDGTAVAGGVGSKGEGIVIGILDSGINFDSGSFDAIEPIGGFAHTNPAGAGTFLGTCATGMVDEGKCNNKVFAAYDFVCGEPARACEEAGLTDEPSVEDNNGHGSHTASTSGGNALRAPYRLDRMFFDGLEGVPFEDSRISVSGVAPHANINAFDVCYTRDSDGAGLCPQVSAVAAVDQAIADGYVDVINFSIGGGQQPWTDSVSQAFLNAHNAGIFVSASAGNSGPGASTLGHVEPWVATVGASTHNRGGFGYPVDIIRGDAVPAPQDIPAAPSTVGGAHNARLAAQIMLSPAFAADAGVATDGCLVGGVGGTNPFPAGLFTGKIAVIRRGTCTFSEKTDNAETAGAVGVILASNQVGSISFGPTAGFTVLIPAFGMAQVDGLAIRTALVADATPPSRATIGDVASILIPAAPDVMGSFSSRGPNAFNVVKPDVTAPGLSILAAVAGPAGAYDLYQGTSMSSPHNAGSAALVRALNPTWTPMQVKSALMMTAKTTGVFKENGTTPSDPLDRGAGRLQLADAVKSGLLLDETGANFLAANPAIPLTPGDPATLNLPSFARQNCTVVNCAFTRQLRGNRPGTVTWNLTVTGPFAAGAVTVLPTSFDLTSGATQSITLTAIAASLSTTAFTFGELVLTPSDGSPTLHMPIVLRAMP